MFGFKTIGSPEMTPWNNLRAQSGWEDISKFTLDFRILNEVLTLGYPKAQS